MSGLVPAFVIVLAIWSAAASSGSAPTSIPSGNVTSPCIFWGNNEYAPFYLVAEPYILILTGHVISALVAIASNVLFEKTCLRKMITSVRIKLIMILFPSDFTASKLYKMQSRPKAKQCFKTELTGFYDSCKPKSRASFEAYYRDVYNCLQERRRGQNSAALNPTESWLCEEFFWKTLTERGTRTPTEEHESNFERVVDAFEELLARFDELEWSDAVARLAFSRLATDPGWLLYHLEGSGLESTASGSRQEELKHTSDMKEAEIPLHPHVAVSQSPYLPQNSKDKKKGRSILVWLRALPKNVGCRGFFALAFGVEILHKQQETNPLSSVEDKLDEVEFQRGIMLEQDKETALLFSSDISVLSLRWNVLFFFFAFIVFDVLNDCPHCTGFEKYQAIYFRLVNSGMATNFWLATAMRLLVLGPTCASYIPFIMASLLLSPALFTHMIPSWLFLPGSMWWGSWVPYVTFGVFQNLNIFTLLFLVIVPSRPTYRCQQLTEWRIFRCWFALSRYRFGDQLLVEDPDNMCAKVQRVLGLVFKAYLRISLTFLGTVIMQMAFNYAMLRHKAYFGPSSGGISGGEAMDFDYDSRRVECSIFAAHAFQIRSSNVLQGVTTML